MAKRMVEVNSAELIEKLSKIVELDGNKVVFGGDVEADGDVIVNGADNIVDKDGNCLTGWEELPNDYVIDTAVGSVLSVGKLWGGKITFTSYPIGAMYGYLYLIRVGNKYYMASEIKDGYIYFLSSIALSTTIDVSAIYRKKWAKYL